MTLLNPATTMPMTHPAAVWPTSRTLIPFDARTLIPLDALEQPGSEPKTFLTSDNIRDILEKAIKKQTVGIKRRWKVDE